MISCCCEKRIVDISIQTHILEHFTDNRTVIPVTFIAYASDALFPSRIDPNAKRISGNVLTVTVDGALDIEKEVLSEPIVLSTDSGVSMIFPIRFSLIF